MENLKAQITTSKANKAFIFRAFNSLALLGGLSLALASCKTPSVQLVSKADKLLPIKADSLPKDRFTDSIINPYRSALAEEMGKVLVQASEPIEKGLPESKLGNLVADICRKRCSIPSDFCILNNGGLRVALPQGAITKGKVFELMPFDNEIVVVTISGEKMKDMFAYIATNKGIPVSGISGKLSSESVTEVKISNEPFDPNKNYRICTTDYLANNGDKMSFFAKPIQIQTTGYKLRDALIDEFTQLGLSGKSLNPALDGRLKN